MRWSEIDLRPPHRTVRQFAGLWLLLCCGLAFRQYLAGAQVAVYVGAGGVGLLGLVKPAWLRPVYVALMLVTLPVGWSLSHLLLALVFFGLFTPLAWILRLIGRDPLGRRLEPARQSYWRPRQAPADVSRYFNTY
jgi:hypothetical protein